MGNPTVEPGHFPQAGANRLTGILTWRTMLSSPPLGAMAPEPRPKSLSPRWHSQKHISNMGQGQNFGDNFRKTQYPWMLSGYNSLNSEKEYKNSTYVFGNCK